LAKGLTGIVYKMFLESSTEFLLNWAMVQIWVFTVSLYNFKVAVKIFGMKSGFRYLL
jgi:hypothetical protein